MRRKIQAQISRLAHKNFAPCEKYEYFCRFTSQDYFNYKCLLADLSKLKDIKIIRYCYTLAIDVYDIEDYRYLSELREKKNYLIEIFYDDLKAGLDQKEAKEAVEDFVHARPEYQEAYNEIYK